MSMKKVIGWTIATSPITGLFIFMGSTAGVLPALIVFGSILLMVAIVVFGFWVAED